MPLTSGTRLGAYEIVSPLGAGGMGEVYRARDTKLGRDVALKILPDAVASEPDSLARFRREAQVLASLNHPHVAQIYGLEESAHAPALVMELVDGVTLQAQLARGPLPINKALAIAQQIAEALETAHDKGIVHRDLKPGNVMLTAAGQVKVLDFGLAAIADGAHRPGVDATHSPTLTLAATRAGVILGTAAYMAPEQAAGRSVDKRADIWSFGVVCWEMLTGRRLFDGETVSHTLADVLRAPIDPAALPHDVPAPVRELLLRCLDRNTATRLRDIGEARVLLQRQSGPAPPAPGVMPVSAPRRWRWQAAIPWTAAVAAGVVAVVAVLTRAAPDASAVRFQIPAPDQTTFTGGGVVSPDGRLIVFPALAPDGRTLLWVRALDSLESRPLAGTEGAQPGPFWSPDSRHVVFGVNGFPGRVKKVEATGGPPQTLTEYEGNYREGAWGRDGTLIFGSSTKGLLRVSSSGGAATPVTTLDPSRESEHAGPVFLPDGRRFLYFRALRTTGTSGGAGGIYLGTLDAAPQNQSNDLLVATDTGPLYLPGSGSRGLMLFLRDGTLLAQPVDDALPAGDPVRLAEDIGQTGSFGWFSASTTGVLVYRTGRGAAQNSELVWRDRTGRRLVQLGAQSPYAGSGIAISPDGLRVTVTRNEGDAAVGAVAGQRIWIADVGRGIFGRLHSADAHQSSPVFTPSGRVVFSTTLNGGVGDLYWMLASGAGMPEPLLVKSPTVKHPNDVSPDGRYLIFDDHTDQRQDLYILPLERANATERQPVPFLVTRADETFGQFSPDGRWVAYSSDESGRREVYVQGFAPDARPAAAVGKWTISTAGGDKPRWSRDGRELFYLAPDGKMMAVPVKLGTTLEPGLPAPLFDAGVLTGFFPYVVSRDGRFLTHMLADGSGAAAPPLTVVLNWTAAAPGR